MKLINDLSATVWLNFSFTNRIIIEACAVVIVHPSSLIKDKPSLSHGLFGCGSQHISYWISVTILKDAGQSLISSHKKIMCTVQTLLLLQTLDCFFISVFKKILNTNLCCCSNSVFSWSRFSRSCFTWCCHFCYFMVVSGIGHFGYNHIQAFLGVCSLWVLRVTSVVVVVIICRRGLVSFGHFSYLWRFSDISWICTQKWHTCFCPDIFFCLSLALHFVLILFLPFMDFSAQLVNLRQKPNVDTRRYSNKGF